MKGNTGEDITISVVKVPSIFAGSLRSLGYASDKELVEASQVGGPLTEAQVEDAMRVIFGVPSDPVGTVHAT